MTINESIYMALSVSDASGVSALLMGNPGAGKTTSVEFFAKANNMRMVLLRGSQSSPEEILGYEVNDGVEHARGSMNIKKASKICPEWYDRLLESSNNGVRTLLFLDEITTASSFVQAALLQLVFGRQIDDNYLLPDDTFVVAAGNYASNLSSEFNLLPPLMNRFCIFNVTLGKSDLKAFMSRYRTRQDIVSKLKNFDAMNSIDTSTLDKSFIDLVKSTMEDKICDYTESLIDNGKFDLNAADMTDIYQDQSNGVELPGFLTPRTMGYFRETAIHMYLKYGTPGVKSGTFHKMAQGLVGVSLGKPNKDNTCSKSYVGDEYAKLIEKVAEQLDKKKVSSVTSTESQLRSLIGKLNTNGEYVSNGVLASSDLIAMKKIFDSAINDRTLRKVTSPLDPKLLMDCTDSLVTSIRNVLRNDEVEVKDLINKPGVDKSMIDITMINGNIKNYNDIIKCFKSMIEFVLIPDFKYANELINKLDKDTRSIMTKNRFRVDFLKKALRDKLGISMSELVETEEVGPSKTK